MNRRNFFKMMSTVGFGYIIASTAGLRNLLAAPPTKNIPPNQTPVSESDPVASAIGFKHNPKDVDKKKYPQFKTGQSCDSCALYVSTNKEWGKCQMLTNGVVAAKGWCGSWSKKA